VKQKEKQWVAIIYASAIATCIFEHTVLSFSLSLRPSSAAFCSDFPKRVQIKKKHSRRKC
jgi:hypothetical protein